MIKKSSLITGAAIMLQLPLNGLEQPQPIPTTQNQKKPEKTAKNGSKSKAKGDQVTQIFNQAKEMWFLEYKRRVGIQPSFTGKEAKSLKLLIGQLWNLETDKSQIIYIFETILNKWDCLPKWYSSNFTLAIINSKLNEILNCLKNGHSEKTGNGVAAGHSNVASFRDAFTQFYCSGE